MRNHGFDRLAASYRRWEWIAFQGDLERARFCHLGQLRDRQSILMLGEGDGRALQRAAALAPRAKIHYLDASSAMLAVAADRISPADRIRITFQQADATTVPLEASAYDAVTTLFFLDCFTPAQAVTLIEKVDRSLRPDGLWLLADFALPAVGWKRWRARVWLKILYAFFRWETGIEANHLPPFESLIRSRGFIAENVCDFQSGLLRSVLLRR